MRTRVPAVLAAFVLAAPACAPRSVLVLNETRPSVPIRVEVAWLGEPSIAGGYGVGPGSSSAVIPPFGSAELSESRIDSSAGSTRFGLWTVRVETLGSPLYLSPPVPSTFAVYRIGPDYKDVTLAIRIEDGQVVAHRLTVPARDGERRGWLFERINFGPLPGSSSSATTP